ncbi:MAG: hypothetical protein KDK05_32400, partial [Candidatus Competibacteraceae bacterium]|nr:hypothetical protein [Candidatus Competibacteraceae bacterium]
MKAIDYWRLCEKLSVRQAAILIMGEDPADYAYGDRVEKPYDALVQALYNGIISEQVEGDIAHPSEYGADDSDSW